MSQSKSPAPASAAPAPSAPHPTSRSSRERDAIDSGQTDDKIAAPDPATSPLGTDDEAAQGHDEDGLKTARAAAAKSPAGR